MATGIVKCFSATKGYGFIKPDDGEAEAAWCLAAHVLALHCSSNAHKGGAGHKYGGDHRVFDGFNRNDFANLRGTLEAGPG
ncbi:cold-shock protein [Bradyrhizobium sp. CCBAU 51627]|uniref:cold-shock protein n=1 Tax=Bradyrhizobium sp. CCBAU 51627 TaxID=1325088 RepID=UPI0023055700|nr:cold shock domain-containing protein [Bradyrhizobium sp. CCBAU 51627]